MKLILLQNFTLITFFTTFGVGAMDFDLSKSGAHDAPSNQFNQRQGQKRNVTEMSPSNNAVPLQPLAKYPKVNDFGAEVITLTPSKVPQEASSRKERYYLKDDKQIKQVLALLTYLDENGKRLSYLEIATQAGCTTKNVQHLASKHGLSVGRVKKTGKENVPPKGSINPRPESSNKRGPANELQEKIQQRLVTNFKKGTWESSTEIATYISATLPCTRNNVRAFSSKSKLTKGGFDAFQEDPNVFFGLNPHVVPLFTPEEVSKLAPTSSVVSLNTNDGIKDKNDPYYNFLPFVLTLKPSQPPQLKSFVALENADALSIAKLMFSLPEGSGQQTTPKQEENSAAEIKLANELLTLATDAQILIEAREVLSALSEAKNQLTVRFKAPILRKTPLANGKRTNTITLERKKIEAVWTLPLKQAASQLNVHPDTLKKEFNRYFESEWPYSEG